MIKQKIRKSRKGMEEKIWTDKEIKLVKDKYPTMELDYLSKLLNRTKNAIVLKASNLNIRRSSKFDRINPPTLIKKLYKKGFTEKEIAEKLNYSVTRVYRALKWFGTKKRSSRESYNIKKYRIIPTDNERQILIGSLLGDGCITKTTEKRNFLRYEEVHSINQRGYLKWKGNFLKRFNPLYIYRAAKKQIFNDQIINTSTQIGLFTKSHPYFNELRNMFYPNGKKNFPEEAISNIDPLALTCWYLDDGWFNYKDNQCNLSSSFENKEAILKLFERYKISPSFYIPPNKNCCHIVFNRENTDKFLGLIEQYVPISMNYKLGHFREENKWRREEAIKKRTIRRRQRYKEIGSWYNL